MIDDVGTSLFFSNRFFVSWLVLFGFDWFVNVGLKASSRTTYIPFSSMSDIRHFLFDNLLLQVSCGHQHPEHFHFVWLIWLFSAVRHCLFGKN